VPGRIAEDRQHDGEADEGRFAPSARFIESGTTRSIDRVD